MPFLTAVGAVIVIYFELFCCGSLQGRGLRKGILLRGINYLSQFENLFQVLSTIQPHPQCPYAPPYPHNRPPVFSIALTCL